jgi:DNA-binding transcriptional regulator of glucitol operon
VAIAPASTMSDTDIALLLFLAIVFLGWWQATSFKSP